MGKAAIGIDIGGTNIKGAAVDVRSGELLTNRLRIPTPDGGMPEDISREVATMVQHIRAQYEQETNEAPEETVGIALPSVVLDGVTYTAANIDAKWVGLDASSLFTAALGYPCEVLNDADAAGIAEAAVGAAKDVSGTVIVLTFGTGIGSACLHNGILVPNFELGHLHLDGNRDAERWASPRVIAQEGITLEEWAQRAARYVQHVEQLIHPQLVVCGGSISKDADQYLPFAGVATHTVPARFRNNAGILGAALTAGRYSGSS